MGVGTLAVVDEDVLCGHGLVDDGNKIYPLGDLVGGRPLFEGRERHDLRPLALVLDDGPVEVGQHAAGGEAVAGGAVLCDLKRDVFGIREHTAL